MLEPDEVKVSSPVLRGLGSSNAPRLPGLLTEAGKRGHRELSVRTRYFCGRAIEVQSDTPRSLGPPQILAFGVELRCLYLSIYSCGTFDSKRNIRHVRRSTSSPLISASPTVAKTGSF